MIESPDNLPRLLRAKGRSMPRQKYQRPEVYATGKREKLWKGEWREYFVGADGQEHSRQKSKTWSRAQYTKSEAQAAFDALMRELQQGGPKADGSMTLEAFWNEVYYPVHSQRWTPNTRAANRYSWSLVKPLWGKPLKEVTKASIDLHLLHLAESGKSTSTVDSALVRLHSILEEALDNDFIPKNPARKVQLPRCKPPKETRSLSEEEVRRLWDKTSGRDYLVWRILLMTGARIGEVLALNRGDLLPEGLRIDESARNGRAETTKNKKTRIAPLCESLRAELQEWLASHPHYLVFTTPGGKMMRRSDIYMRAIQETARTAAGISDLTYRMCRTTFATLFEGDIRDAQEILGHHSAAFTLQVYRKPVAARQQGAVDAMDKRLRNVVEIRRAG